MEAAVLASFLDELEKIAAAHGRLRAPKERRGRRPMSVTTLLRKEKDGTLYKDAYVANVRAGNIDDPGAAVPPRRQGEVPSKKNDPNRIDLNDRRADASIQPSGSTTLSDVAARSDHY